MFHPNCGQTWDTYESLRIWNKKDTPLEMIYGIGSEKVMTQNGQIARRHNSIFHKIWNKFVVICYA